MVEFKEWPKIPRGQNETITITEKIDGTNACVIVGGDDEFPTVIGCQSRTRLIYPGKDTDNYGFASWVEKNKDDLVKLGVGYHYGEWAGEGIQKNHHNIEGKKFFLFNTARWNDDNPNCPDCCDVVPVLYNGEFNVRPQGISIIDYIMDELKNNAENQGYTPEGIVVYFHKTKRYEKYTFKNPEGKWKEAN